jgi:hypothetical protein
MRTEPLRTEPLRTDGDGGTGAPPRLAAAAAPVGVAVAVAALGAVAVWLVPAGHDGTGADSAWGQAVMIVVGLPLLLFVPGLCLSFALVVERLGTATRATLAVALSLAVTVIGGLVLTALPGGLTRTSWLLWSVGAVLGCWAAAVARMMRRPGGDGARPAWGWWSSRAGGQGRASITGVARRAGRSLRARAVPLVLGALAVVIAASAVTLSVVSERAVKKPAFAELSVSPQGPVTSRKREIVVAVHNVDDGLSRYSLRIQTGDTAPSDREISLAPGREASISVEVPLGQRVQADLFRGNSLYRHVSLDVS